MKGKKINLSDKNVSIYGEETIPMYNGFKSGKELG